MKLKFMLIGIALVLMLCISPVAAVCGDGFEIVIGNTDGIESHTYYYKDNPNEKYTEIYTPGSYFHYSKIMFRPANIPDAPMMFVDVSDERYIYLPQCVDDWEIRYYTCHSDMNCGDHSGHNHFKNEGVVNLNEYFGEHIKYGLFLVQIGNPIIASQWDPLSKPYYIPDVD